ncbi:MAG: class I SAM-dependent methyltransferase [Clostridia bacterium]|nr:class I SAM-dependent methyltransferase [Clostridia bacterium]
MYTAFAQVYDELMAEVNYPAWADYYRQLMARYGIREGKICECACGTGALTMHFYRMGFQVTGVDLSQDMLFEASKKARSQGAAIPFVKQDMRELHLHRPMDAVLATCDGVNYLTQPGDLEAFLKAAYNALRPGGGLFFDISTPYKLAQVLGDQFLGEDTPHITYLWQNHYSPKTHLSQMDLCFFVKQPDGSYKRLDESQVQRAFEGEEILSALEKAGFSQASWYGDGHFTRPGPTEHRWHFAALKRQDI